MTRPSVVLKYRGEKPWRFTVEDAVNAAACEYTFMIEDSEHRLMQELEATQKILGRLLERLIDRGLMPPAELERILGVKLENSREA